MEKKKKNLTEKKNKHLREYGNVFHTCFPHESGSIPCTDTSCRLAPTCGAKPSVSTAQSHEKHREKPRGTAGIPGKTMQDTISQHFFPQDIRVLLLLLNTLKTSHEQEGSSLVLDPPEFGGALTPLQKVQLQQPHSALPCASCRAGTGKHRLV